jgi:UDP-N-acetylmuramate--alanine ligase
MPGPAGVLSLGFKEEFPRKDAFLVETLISRDGAANETPLLTKEGMFQL